MFEMLPFGHKNQFPLYNPFRDLEEFEKTLFGDFGNGFRADIQDQGDSYLLEADLPGLRKEDIAVDINGDYLTVSAQRSSESEEKDDKSNYVRRERSFGSYSRSFDISNVKSEEIRASYENGVLRLLMPKKTGNAPSSRRLEIQ